MTRGGWRPPETADELERRRAFVTPKRARMIRAEIEADPAPAAVAGGRLCGLAAAAVCYLPAARCCERAQ